jgi:hypothetical protein
MIFNEYDEYTSNEAVKRRNKDNTKINFDKIIDLAKNMKPIYKDILPEEERYELQEPESGTMIGNYRQFKYKKILIRKYKDFPKEEDFGRDEIIERPEILGNILVQEIETDWEECPQESTQQIKKYKKYKKRIFIDESGNQFEPENFNKPKIEILNEKSVKEIFETKTVGNIKKNFKYNEVRYSDNPNSPLEENRQLINEIKEGETNWEPDNIFNSQNPNKKKTVKYKTITIYDNIGNIISPTQRTNEIIDWEIIETRIEKDNPTNTTETIIGYYTKTSIFKQTKNNLDLIQQPGGGNELTRIEEFREEYDDPIKNILVK